MANTEIGLSSCPNEVLELICVFVCNHCAAEDLEISDPNDNGTTDLNNLCHVSKRLYRIAQPILFHKFQSYTEAKSRVTLFLRSLIDRPDLRMSVCEVGLSFAGLFKRPLVEQLRLVMGDTTEQIFTHTAMIPEQEVSERSVIGMVLSLTPNLAALRSSAVPLLAPQVHSHYSPLPKLRKLYIASSSTDCKDLAIFLRKAPNVETLITYGLSCSKYSDHDYHLMLTEPTTLQGLGNIHHLILTSCYVHPTALATIISKCGPLQIFFLSTARTPDREYGYDRPIPTIPLTPWRALLEKRESLRSITIAGGVYPFDISPEDDPCFLRYFKCLEELEMDSSASKSLLDHWKAHGMSNQEGFLVQTLPDSIRQLTMVNAPAGLIDPVRDLALIMQDGRFPNFKLLNLKPQFGETWPQKYAWIRYFPELCTSLQQVGVTLRMNSILMSSELGRYLW